MLEIDVNLLFIRKLLNINIKINFYKSECTLIKNNVILINTRYYNLFFLNL